MVCIKPQHLIKKIFNQFLQAAVGQTKFPFFLTFYLGWGILLMSSKNGVIKYQPKSNSLEHSTEFINTPTKSYKPS
jgi:hypothetical protein